MTKRLILIRHAKSSWDSPGDDHARPLNARGRAAAFGVGQWLQQSGYSPDQILTSDAARTLETTEKLVSAFERRPVITLCPDLYHGSPDDLWARLLQADGETVAIVAHNPGIAFFAENIVANAPGHPRFYDYPTAATLVCSFPIQTWADAVARSAHVLDFIVPKDLERG